MDRIVGWKPRCEKPIGLMSVIIGTHTHAGCPPDDGTAWLLKPPSDL
jgi:hypothetical protein